LLNHTFFDLMPLKMRYRQNVLMSRLETECKGIRGATGFMADHRPGAVISCFQKRGDCRHPGDGLFRLFVPGSDGCKKIACVRYRFVLFLCGSISCHPLKLSYLGTFVESVF
jgi:hypothetical protein